MGNHGTLEKKLTAIITDAELLYHFGYITFCTCGILLHPFFYSVLVRLFNTNCFAILNFNTRKILLVVRYCIQGRNVAQRDKIRH